jgi:pyruvate dehydrogenase E2 component (dihydrolipoamide acetyltransferase)
MEVLRDLIPRVRFGRLRSCELTDAMITMTNLGDLGVETVYGVIYPLQVTLVGFAKITEQLWADDGISLHEALGADILEADYCRLTTLSDIIGYLSVRVP